MLGSQVGFFDHIVSLAEERVVTADDFQPYVGCHNWLLMDDDGIYEDAIYQFVVRRVFGNGRVEILIGVGENWAITRNVENGVAMHITADELAIRMDAS